MGPRSSTVRSRSQEKSTRQRDAAGPNQGFVFPKVRLAMPREVGNSVNFVDFDPRVSHLKGNDSRKAAPPAGPLVEILPATAFTAESICWVWPGWLARGKFHLLAGAPGTGKTTIGISAAATITTGGRWPDGTAAERGDVLIWTGED